MTNENDNYVMGVDIEQRRYETALRLLPFFLKTGNSNLVTNALQNAVNDAVETADLLIERLAEKGDRR